MCVVVSRCGCQPVCLLVFVRGKRARVCVCVTHSRRMLRMQDMSSSLPFAFPFFLAYYCPDACSRAQKERKEESTAAFKRVHRWASLSRRACVCDCHFLCRKVLPLALPMFLPSSPPFYCRRRRCSESDVFSVCLRCLVCARGKMALEE